jgi:hypothetical protein
MASNKITKTEAAQLRGLMKESGWDVVIRILADEIDAIRSEEIAGNNEFEELRMLHLNRGRVQGLKEFFDKLERGAIE